MQKNEFNSILKSSIVTKFDVATSSVVKNTFALLSMTILFSALTAFLAVITNASSMGSGLLMFTSMIMIYLIQYFRNSALGVLWVFAFTGISGYSLGPLLNVILKGYANGSDIIITTLGLTGTIFLSLACYVHVTRKSFNYLKGFLFAGSITIFLISIAALLLNWNINTLIFSGAIALLSTGWILFDVSRIINNEETNYIIATLNLYINIFNLFVSLLMIIVNLVNDRRN